MRRQGVVLLILPLMAAAVACERHPAAPPSDPMLEAIQSQEREAGLNYAESQGKHLFDQYCVTCHGDLGKGDGQNASNLDPPPPDLTASKNMSDAAYVRRVISEGSAATGRSPLSPPWGRSLRPQEIEYVTLYCRSLARKKP